MEHLKFVGVFPIVSLRLQFRHEVSEAFWRKVLCRSVPVSQSLSLQLKDVRPEARWKQAGSEV